MRRSRNVTRYWPPRELPRHGFRSHSVVLGLHPAAVDGAYAVIVIRTTFAETLINFRTARGWTQADLAERLHVSRSLVEKIEQGIARPQPDFAADCDKLFGVPKVFAVLQRDAMRQAHPAWFTPRVDLETNADSIIDWEPRAPHGLLQTEEFARSMIEASPFDPPSVIENAVQSRLERQKIFDREPPPRLWAILYEASLVQVVGSASVMRGQLDKLIAVAEGRYAVIQILPFKCADAPGARGPLALFERAGHPPVAYAEGWDSGRVIEQPDEVAAVITALNVIKSSALGPRDSLALLKKTREAW